MFSGNVSLVLISFTPLSIPLKIVMTVSSTGAAAAATGAAATAAGAAATAAGAAAGCASGTSIEILPPTFGFKISRANFRSKLYLCTSFKYVGAMCERPDVNAPPEVKETTHS